MSEAEIRRNLWDRAANTWRRLVDTGTVAWNTSTPGVASASIPNGGIGTAQLADNSVTLAKLQDIASARILGRATAGSGDPEELTLSQVLDLIGGAAQGDILYRGASSWARLPAGTLGQFLQTQGAGANPLWVASGSGLVLLNSDVHSSAANLDIVLTGYTAYRGIKFVLTGLQPATDAVELWLRFSTDGGATYITTASYNYSGAGSAEGTGFGFGAAGATRIELTRNAANSHLSNAAGHGLNIEVDLLNQASGSFFPRVTWRGSYFSDADIGFYVDGAGMYEVAQDTDAVRFLVSNLGNFSTNWAVYGYA